MFEVAHVMDGIAMPIATKFLYSPLHISTVTVEGECVLATR